MTRSMTGYGRASGNYEGRELTVEIRSVNQRGFEFSSRLPRNMNVFEDRLRKIVAENLTRGKVELSLSVTGEIPQIVTADESVAHAYLDAVRKLAEEFSLKDDLSASSLLSLDGLFTLTRPEEDETALWAALEPIAREAAEKHTAMRRTEGEQMCRDVFSRLDFIESKVSAIEIRSPETVKEYRERLTAKMQEILQSAEIDTARILTEAAIYSDKIAVDEETVRLRSHIAQFRAMLTENEAVGRKPDFLVQEMGREINTIGSKCSDLDITRMVLDMKNEMEKIREQVQNLE